MIYGSVMVVVVEEEGREEVRRDEGRRDGSVT